MEMTPITQEDLCRKQCETCYERFKRIEDIQKLQLDNAKELVVSARLDMERRLEVMNGLQKQLNVQSKEQREKERDFVTMSYYQLEHKLLSNNIEKLSDWKLVQDGKHSGQTVAVFIALILSFVATLFAVLHFFVGRS